MGGGGRAEEGGGTYKMDWPSRLQLISKFRFSRSGILEQYLFAILVVCFFTYKPRWKEKNNKY